jgi:hypothetical protein
VILFITKGKKPPAGGNGKDHMLLAGGSFDDRSCFR